ncbi:ribonuclease G [Eubacterium ruminantium]|nr:ribonuclease G [Eubacterium ruminantium]
MKGRILITNSKCGNVSFIYENSLLTEVHPVSGDSIVGNIYVAVVDNIVDNLKAAFLRIADGTSIYYSLEENDGKHIFIKHGKGKDVKKGDWLLVQITKDAVGNKRCQATSDISMKGKYSVINRSARAGVSKRITDDKKRNHLKELFEGLKAGYPDEFNDDYGVIFRSAAVSADDLNIELDTIRTLRKLKGYVEKAYHEVAGALIYERQENVAVFLEDIIAKNIYEELTVITDQKEVYDDLIEGNFEYKSLVNYHEDTNQSLRALYNIDRELEIMFGHKIYLPSGGYLVVDLTEALTVIDVNTGKDVKGSNIENHMRKTNMEAADMIARILRTRNISGIILVDFINMKKSESIDSVINNLKNGISKDLTKCFFVDMTALGLAELTRQKGRRRFELSELLEK